MRGRRLKNYFTSEQIRQLKKNPFTHTVTSTNIKYTKEFKEMFWLRYQKGEMVKDIFRLAGYDPKVLGDGRIYNFSYQLARAMEAGKNLEETPRENSSTHHEHDSRIAALEQEILYLRQQIESLKHALTSPLALELPD